MDTTELQQVVLALGYRTQQLSRELSELSGKVEELRNQVSDYKATAQSILERVTYENDYRRSSDMLSQARAYLSRAEQCESSAAQLEMQLGSVRDELQSCKGEYKDYQAEAEANLETLNLTVVKLEPLTRAQYGSDKFIATLKLTRQKILTNRELADKCRRNIDWIDQTCGTSGSQPVKKLTLY